MQTKTAGGKPTFLTQSLSIETEVIDPESLSSWKSPRTRKVSKVKKVGLPPLLWFAIGASAEAIEPAIL
jgi:hypothetical protein